MVWWWLISLAQAGLGPDDVVVLYNGDDADALATAEQYAAARDLTPAQLCPISGITPDTRQIDFDTFDTQIRQPFEACRDALPHPEDIDAIVVVRGLPYVVELPDYVASLSATLQVGRATRTSDGADVAGLPQARTNDSRRLALASILNPQYAPGGGYASEMTASYGYNPGYVKSPQFVHGEVKPGPFVRYEVSSSGAYDFGGELYIVTRLDGFDHDDARALVDRAVAADGSFPEAPFLCMHAADGARGVRDAECEHALRMLDAAGFNTAWVDTFDGELTRDDVVAYWTGAASMRGAIDGVGFAPGAIADNLTSFGARPNNFFCDETGETCPESESQTSIARFVRAGATGVQGTVAEPLNNCFPNAGTLILYSQGFSMGEAWIANQRYLHWVNTYLGDPLTTPFAERPAVTVPAAAIVDVPIAIDAAHEHGVRGLTVYLDGDKVYTRDGNSEDGSLVPADWGLAAGDAAELFVVAIADDAEPVDVDGWPAEPVTFYPRTKGWTRATVSLEAPIEPEPEGGCGCRNAVGPMGWIGLAMPMMLMWMRRRRR